MKGSSLWRRLMDKMSSLAKPTDGTPRNLFLFALIRDKFPNDREGD